MLEAKQKEKNRWDKPVSISRESHRKLAIIAKAEDRPKSWILDRLITKRLEELKVNPEKRIEEVAISK